MKIVIEVHIDSSQESGLEAVESLAHTLVAVAELTPIVENVSYKIHEE